MLVTAVGRRMLGRVSPGWRGFSFSWEAIQPLTHRQGGDAAPLAAAAGRVCIFAADHGRFPDVNSKGSDPVIAALAKGLLALKLLLLRAG